MLGPVTQTRGWGWEDIDVVAVGLSYLAAGAGRPPAEKSPRLQEDQEGRNPAGEPCGMGAQGHCSPTAGVEWWSCPAAMREPLSRPLPHHAFSQL